MSNTIALLRDSYLVDEEQMSWNCVAGSSGETECQIDSEILGYWDTKLSEIYKLESPEREKAFVRAALGL